MIILYIVFLDLVHDGLPSNEGCSDQELGSTQGSGSDSSSVLSLSEFSSTPTNSLINDEGGEGDLQEAEIHSPDHIQMDVKFPQEQFKGYPIEAQVQLAEIPVPFPPTPDHADVSEPQPMIEPHSYKDIKDSTYFKENNMVKKKVTKKLTKKEKA